MGHFKHLKTCTSKGLASLMSALLAISTMPVTAFAENTGNVPAEAADSGNNLSDNGNENVSAVGGAAEDANPISAAENRADEIASMVSDIPRRDIGTLVIAKADDRTVMEHEPVVANFENIYLLAYGNEQEAAQAADRLDELGEFAEVDSEVIAAADTDGETFIDTAPKPDDGTSTSNVVEFDEREQADSLVTDANDNPSNEVVPGESTSTQDETPANAPTDDNLPANPDGQPSANAVPRSLVDNLKLQDEPQDEPLGPVRVALLDSGATDSPKIVKALSMLGDDVTDESGHAARMLQHILQAAPETEIVSIKVLDKNGHGTISEVYAGIMAAIEEDVDIINLSLTARVSENSAAIADAIEQAQQEGITVVAAAGNSNADVSGFVPAGIDTVYTAGSCTREGVRSATSNFGAAVDIWAVSNFTSDAAAMLTGWLASHRGEDGQFAGLAAAFADTRFFASVMNPQPETNAEETKPDETAPTNPTNEDDEPDFITAAGINMTASNAPELRAGKSRAGSLSGIAQPTIYFNKRMKGNQDVTGSLPMKEAKVTLSKTYKSRLKFGAREWSPSYGDVYGLWFDAKKTNGTYGSTSDPLAHMVWENVANSQSSTGDLHSPVQYDFHFVLNSLTVRQMGFNKGWIAVIENADSVYYYPKGDEGYIDLDADQVGVELDVTMYFTETKKTAPVAGSTIFAIDDIDIRDKVYNLNGGYYYQNSKNYFTEGVQMISGFGQTTGSARKIYIQSVFDTENATRNLLDLSNLSNGWVRSTQAYTGFNWPTGFITAVDTKGARMKYRGSDCGIVIFELGRNVSPIWVKDKNSDSKPGVSDKGIIDKNVDNNGVNTSTDQSRTSTSYRTTNLNFLGKATYRIGAKTGYRVSKIAIGEGTDGAILHTWNASQTNIPDKINFSAAPTSFSNNNNNNIRADRNYRIIVTTEKVPDITVTPNITKVLTGKSLSAGDFKFTMTSNSNAAGSNWKSIVSSGSNANVSNKANGTIPLPTITYQYSGQDWQASDPPLAYPVTYTYKIKEVNEKKTRIGYDSKTITMTVKIKFNKNSGRLESEVTYSDSDNVSGNDKRFENSYMRTCGLDVKKVSAAGTPLSGARFAVYKLPANASLPVTRTQALSGTRVSTKDSNSNGIASWPNTTFNCDGSKYAVVEISPPAGYNLNTTWVQSFQAPTTTTDKHVFSYTSSSTWCSNTQKTCGVQTKKVNTSGSALSGAVFAIYKIPASMSLPVTRPEALSRGTKVTTITSGANGIAATENTAFKCDGTKYAIIEQSPPSGFTLNDTWVQSFEAATSTADKYMFNYTTSPNWCSNKFRTCGVKAKKVDSSGNPLAGAVFAVYRLPTTMTTSVTRAQAIANGTKMNIMTSASDGIAQLPGSTYENDDRIYAVIEETAPEGYNLNTTWIKTFTAASSTTNGHVFDFTSNSNWCSNTQKTCNVRAKKVDEKNQPLSGAQFALYRLAANTDLSGLTRASLLTLISNGTATRVGGNVTSNEQGLVSWDGLVNNNAKYAVIETEPPAGYQLNTSWFKTFTAAKSVADNYTFNFTDSNNWCVDKRTRSGVSVKKVSSANTSQGLQGAVFSIYKLPASTDLSNIITYSDVKSVGSLVITMTSNANGIATLTETFGNDGSKYAVIETTPPSKFLLNTTWVKTFQPSAQDAHGNMFDFTLNSNDWCQNEPKPARGGIKVKKVDADDGTGIPNAEFSVYMLDSIPASITREYVLANGTKQIDMVSAPDGIAQSGKKLPAANKKYAVIETAAPNGYRVNTTWLKTFTLTTDGQIIDLSSNSDACADPKSPASVRIEAAKELLGQTLEEGQFQFTLEGLSLPGIAAPKPAVPITVSNTSAGMVSFPTIEFDSSDVGSTFIYKITESPVNDFQMNCDLTPRYAKVVVSNSGSNVVARLTYNRPGATIGTEPTSADISAMDSTDPPIFTNVFVPRCGASATKLDAVTGEGLEGAVFEITKDDPSSTTAKLYDASGAEVSNLLITTNEYGVAKTPQQLKDGNLIDLALVCGETYKIREVSAPTGYAIDNPAWRTFIAGSGTTEATAAVNASVQPSFAHKASPVVVPVFYSGETSGSDVARNVFNYDVAIIDGATSASDVDCLSVLNAEASHSVGHADAIVKYIRDENPNAKILSIEAFDASGTASVSDACSGIRLAINAGAKVIVLPFSMYSPDGNAELGEAVNAAYASGIVVVGSAGEYAADASLFIPSNLEHILIAGSCSEDETDLLGSNYGHDVDVYVPSRSTSEAAARVAGWVSANSSFDTLFQDIDSTFTSKKGLFHDSDIGQSGISKKPNMVYENVLRSQVSFIYYDSSGTKHTYSGTWKKGSGSNSSKWWVEYSDGSYPQSCWVYDCGSGKWCYFDSGGWALQNTVVFLQGSNYSSEKFVYGFDSNCYSVTGSATIGGTTYTFSQKYTTQAAANANSGTLYTGTQGDGSGYWGPVDEVYGAQSVAMYAKLTFDANGGSGGKTKFRYSDKPITQFPSVTRTGYTLAGWYTAKSGGTKITTSTKVPRSNTTYYAHWTANTYKVTFDRQNGSGGSASVTATYASAMPSATMPTRTGYTFAGYYDATSGGTQYYTAAGASARTWNKTAATTLYARWTANKYTVTLNQQSGSGGTTSVSATYGSAMPSATMPTRTGYTFAGYYDATSGGTQYYTAAGASARAWNKAAATTLYARWTPKTYTVTLNQQSGSGGTASVTATYAAAMPTATMPTRTGYTFGGYYDATGGSGTQYYTAAGASARAWNKTAATTLYAKWTPNTYTVTFDKQSGTGGSSSVTATYAAAMPTATMPTRTGYTFAGYYDATSGGTQYYTAAGASARTWNKTAATTLYARWTPNTYTVTLNQQSGTGGTASVTATYAAAMPTATMPTRTGYTFGGYYDATGGSGTQYYTATGASARAWNKTAATTLYAKWTPKTVTVTYNANGGSGSDQTRTYTYDVSGQTLLNPGYTRAGYRQLGWSESSTATEASWSTTSSVSNSWINAKTSRTLYAVWKVNVLTVKFHANGGTIVTGTGETQNRVGSDSLIERSTDSGSTWADAVTNINITMTYPNLWDVSSFGLTKTGYHVDGTSAWNTKSDGSGLDVNQAYSETSLLNPSTAYRLNGNANLTADKDMTVYANWKPNTYSISYAGMSGASYGANHPTSATYDTAFTVNLPSKPGYTFTGWNVSGMDSVTHTYGSSTTTNTTLTNTKATSFKNLRSTSGTVTFTATWIPNTYTIAYLGMDDATFGADHPTSASYDTAFTVSLPTHDDDREFLGWHISGMDETDHVIGNQTISTDIAEGVIDTSFKNLRRTAGTVTFRAVWEGVIWDNGGVYPTGTFTDTPLVGAELIKADAETSEVLAGATFEITGDSGAPLYDANGNIVSNLTITTGPDGSASTPPHSLMLGRTYFVREIGTPDGYVNDNTQATQFTPEALGQSYSRIYDLGTFYDRQRIGGYLSKSDTETGAPLSGAIFEIQPYDSEDLTLYDATGATVPSLTVTTGEDGKAATHSRAFIPGESYKVRESAAPELYINDNAEWVEFTATPQAGVDLVDMGSYSDTRSKRCGVMLLKLDEITNARIEGATFTITPVSTDAKIYNEQNVEIQNATIVTNKDGIAATHPRALIPGETYEVLETAAPGGYLIDEAPRQFTVGTQQSNLFTTSQAYAVVSPGDSTLYFMRSSTYEGAGTGEGGSVASVSGDVRNGYVFGGFEDEQTLYDWSNNLYAVLAGAPGIDAQGILHIEFIDPIRPNSGAGMFSGGAWDNSGYMTSNLQDIGSLIKLDTSHMSSMEGMFSGCAALDGVDLTNFDTLGVTNMADMFAGCISLEDLDLSLFNVENVADASRMFSGCSSLSTIYASSNWAEHGLAGNDMFEGCYALSGTDPNWGSYAFDAAEYGIGSEMGMIATPDTPGYLTYRVAFASASAAVATNDGDIVSIGMFHNKPLTGAFLVKTDKETNEALANAEFTIVGVSPGAKIFDNNGIEIASLTIMSDSGGIAATSDRALVAGETYSVQETLAPPGYEIDDTEPRLFVTRAGALTEIGAFVDTHILWTGTQVRKTDGETGAYLAGARFEILGLDPGSAIQDSTGQPIDRLVIESGPDGFAATPEASLRKGQNYSIREIQAPPGYCIQDDTAHPFTAGDDTHDLGIVTNQKAYTQFAPIIYKNYKKLVGDGVYVPQPAESGEFSFTLFEQGENADDITEISSAGSSAWDGTGDFTVEFPPIEYTFEDVGTHTYIVNETVGSAPGIIYDNVPKIITVDVSQQTVDGSTVLTASSNTAQAQRTFENIYVPGFDVAITKLSAEDDSPVAGAEFSVYEIPALESASTPTIPAVLTDRTLFNACFNHVSQGMIEQFIPDNAVLASTYGMELAATLTSDSDGVARTTGGALSSGQAYAIVETKAPAGYLLEDSTHLPTFCLLGDFDGSGDAMNAGTTFLTPDGLAASVDSDEAFEGYVGTIGTPTVSWGELVFENPRNPAPSGGISVNKADVTTDELLDGAVFYVYDNAEFEAKYADWISNGGNDDYQFLHEVAFDGFSDEDETIPASAYYIEPAAILGTSVDGTYYSSPNELELGTAYRVVEMIAPKGYDLPAYDLTMETDLSGNWIVEPDIEDGYTNVSHEQNDLVFRNGKLPPQDGSAQIVARKYGKNGLAINDGDYQFILRDKNGNAIGDPVSNDAEGYVRFPIMYFSEENDGDLGTHAFTVEEVIPDDAEALIDGSSVTWAQATAEQKADLDLMWVKNVGTNENPKNIIYDAHVHKVLLYVMHNEDPDATELVCHVLDDPEFYNSTMLVRANMLLGGAMVYKEDAETHEPLEGAEFTAINVNDPTDVHVATSNAGGYARFPDELFVGETYIIIETGAPLGYALNTNWSVTVDILEEEMYDMTEEPCSDEVAPSISLPLTGASGVSYGLLVVFAALVAGLILRKRQDIKRVRAQLK